MTTQGGADKDESLSPNKKAGGRQSLEGEIEEEV
jgi:hypothetical protein